MSLKARPPDSDGQNDYHCDDAKTPNVAHQRYFFISGFMA